MTTIQAYPFDHFATTEAGERWLAEVAVDFTAFDAVQFAASLEAVTRGVGGTFRIRLGGTSRTVDGMGLLTFPADSSSEWIGGLVDVPRVVARGTVLFKLTATSSSQDSVAEINAGTLTLWVEDTNTPLVFKMLDQLGVDIWMGDDAGDGVPNYNVLPSGDWRLVSGREAVKQSLRRRFMTSPGEWATKPDYGAGLRAAVKSRARQSDIDDIVNRLRSQAMKDTRVLAVLSVTATRLGTYGIAYRIVVQLKGDDGTPLEVTDNIPESAS